MSILYRLELYRIVGWYYSVKRLYPLLISCKNERKTNTSVRCITIFLDMLMFKLLSAFIPCLETASYYATLLLH